MHSTRGNIKFTPFGDAYELIDELFDLLSSRYQGNLETPMRGSDLFLIQFN